MLECERGEPRDSPHALNYQSQRKMFLGGPYNVVMQSVHMTYNPYNEPNITNYIHLHVCKTFYKLFSTA